MTAFLPASTVDGPDGAPWIVLSNSLASDSSLWQPQIRFLAERYRILRYDTRGHGASQTPAPPYSLDDLVGDVVRLLDAHSIDKAAFMGISLGGMTGLGLALSHPGRVTRLVCCDARADAPPPFVKMWEERIESVRQDGLGPIVDGTIQRWVNERFQKQQPSEVARLREMILGTRVDGYIGCASALLTLRYLERLDDLRTPTLFVVGSEDAAAPPAVMQDMARRVTGSEIEVIDGAAHLPNLDSPDAFAEAVGAFLEIS